MADQNKNLVYGLLDSDTEMDTIFHIRGYYYLLNTKDIIPD